MFGMLIFLFHIALFCLFVRLPRPQEVCVRSYSSQLARLHVEHYLYMLMHSVPDSAAMNADTPVSSKC